MVFRLLCIYDLIKKVYIKVVYVLIVFSFMLSSYNMAYAQEYWGPNSSVNIINNSSYSANFDSFHPTSGGGFSYEELVNHTPLIQPGQSGSITVKQWVTTDRQGYQ